MQLHCVVVRGSCKLHKGGIIQGNDMLNCREVLNEKNVQKIFDKERKAVQKLIGTLLYSYSNAINVFNSISIKVS